MKVKYLTWYSGGYYRLFEDGKIEKPDGYLSDGKSWEFVGLLEKKPFGQSGELIPREKAVNMTKDELYFKNGRPKYWVVDKDHGTRRVWCGPQS